MVLLLIRCCVSRILLILGTVQESCSVSGKSNAIYEIQALTDVLMILMPGTVRLLSGVEGSRFMGYVVVVERYCSKS